MVTINPGLPYIGHKALTVEVKDSPEIIAKMKVDYPYKKFLIK